MTKADANLTLAGIAFIAASVSKFQTVEHSLYLLSVAFLIPVALSELRAGMLWLSGKIDNARGKIETLSRVREARDHALKRRSAADDNEEPT